MNNLLIYKGNISEKIHRLRRDRRWTQIQFAKLLGLSQSRLSQIERGRGSLTAEQFLLILKTFNLPLNYFIETSADNKTDVQNALIRLGAKSLSESEGAFPSEKFADMVTLAKEVLNTAESSRQIVSLGAILINHARRPELIRLWKNFDEIGLGNRVGWLAENTLNALKVGLGTALPREWKRKYKRAELILGAFIKSPFFQQRKTGAEDILDSDIASEKTLEQVRTSASDISKKWQIVTRIQPSDFVAALRGAREDH